VAAIHGVAAASSGQVGGVYGEATNSMMGIGVLGVGTHFGGYFLSPAPGYGALIADGVIGFKPDYFSEGNDNLCAYDDARLAPFRGIGYCSSSLRFKTDVRPFTGGLDLVTRLRPITFAWRTSGKRDVGFGAEDVEQVEPLLTFRNPEGQIQGVKYDKLSAVFVNAIREQQGQIERQQRRIKRQQDQITQQHDQIAQQQKALAVQRKELAALKTLVCSGHQDAEVCR
jgi:hypothetical protein